MQLHVWVRQWQVGAVLVRSVYTVLQPFPRTMHVEVCVGGWGVEYVVGVQCAP